MTAKKLTKKSTTSSGIMTHPRPWRNIGLGLLVVAGLITLLVVIGNYLAERQGIDKFRTIENRLSSVTQKLGDDNGVDFIVKKSNMCERKYTGFNSTLTCGTYLAFTSRSAISRLSQREIILSAANKAGIALSYSSETTSPEQIVSGDINFLIGLGECGGYWQAASDAQTEYTMYCRDTSDRILPGYTVIN